MASGSADAKRNWQHGTWRDADRTIHAVHAGIASGTIISGCVFTSDGGKQLGFQICVIETMDAFYFVRKGLNFLASNGIPITADGLAQFAVEDETLYAIGDDSKEYKLHIVIRVPKTPQ